MNGTIVQRYGGYFIIQIIKSGVIPIQQKLFPIYPKDKLDESKLNTLVDFNLIDESSHPELYKGVICLKGTKYARLID